MGFLLWRLLFVGALFFSSCLFPSDGPSGAEPVIHFNGAQRLSGELSDFVKDAFWRASRFHRIEARIYDYLSINRLFIVIKYSYATWLCISYRNNVFDSFFGGISQKQLDLLRWKVKPRLVQEKSKSIDELGALSIGELDSLFG